MVNRFTLKTLFAPEEIRNLISNFGFRRMPEEEVLAALDQAFSNYILAALTEIGSDPDERKQIYLESSFHLEKASKLLNGMPHPAGKMSFRIRHMLQTLYKLIEGDEFSADRATRFMEKNLVRHLRDLWVVNTSTPFHTGSDGSGRNPSDFLVNCFQAAAAQYPEIQWFESIDQNRADQMIKSIKR